MLCFITSGVFENCRQFDIAMMKDISQSCKKIEKSSVESTAYFRALGEAKGLNMDKHRIQVERELDHDAVKGRHLSKFKHPF